MEFITGTIEINMQKNKGLILYTRLPDYFYQSILHFCKKYNFYCDVVKFDQDINTSFEFKENEFIKFYNRSELNKNDFLNQDYLFVYTSTWNDSEYKIICKHYRNLIPVILGMDNPWLGNWKQKVHSLIADFTVKKYFNYIWVPGPPQKKYATKLGFNDNRILEGLYTCDTDKFIYKELNTDSKTILFVGRFVEYKKPLELAQVFSELISENKEFASWKLLMAGRGPLYDEIVNFNSSSIQIIDFVKPDNLPELFHASTIFCLPSQNEHWGVVVHEAACSGLPLIISDTVYSHSSFLVHKQNGLKFKSGSDEDLKLSLKKMMKAEANHLKEMGKKSNELGTKINKDTWSDLLFKVIKLA